MTDNDQELALLYLTRAIDIMSMDPEGASGKPPMSKLPMQMIQKLKREPASGRYGKTDVMDATDYEIDVCLFENGSLTEVRVP